jgi:hypothetical protein
MFQCTLDSKQGVFFPYTELVDSDGDGLSTTTTTTTPKMPVTPTPGTCILSPTLVDGKSACQGQLIFEENFDTLEPSKWEHDIRVAGSPVRGTVHLIGTRNVLGL